MCPVSNPESSCEYINEVYKHKSKFTIPGLVPVDYESGNVIHLVLFKYKRPGPEVKLKFGLPPTTTTPNFP